MRNCHVMDCPARNSSGGYCPRCDNNAGGASIAVIPPEFYPVNLRKPMLGQVTVARLDWAGNISIKTETE